MYVSQDVCKSIVPLEAQSCQNYRSDQLWVCIAESDKPPRMEMPQPLSNSALPSKRKSFSK